MVNSNTVTTESPDDDSRRPKRTASVIVVGSVMFSFISYWRVAAVVLCDMASTAFYIGGIVEQVIGPAAPWFIGCVMLFSFAMGAVYIESCSLFVRGGVYRVVKEAIGGLPAKAAVSPSAFPRPSRPRRKPSLSRRLPPFRRSRQTWDWKSRNGNGKASSFWA